MDIVYKYFDKFTNMIPDNVQHMIRLGALLAWVILATIVIYISWDSGAQSAPELGQELSLSNIKEEIAREQNINKVGDVVLPDLNELIRERYKTKAEEQPQQVRAMENPLASPDLKPIESQNPVRSYNERDRNQGPVYQGNQLSPYVTDEYEPLKDRGTGGVRQAGQIQQQKKLNPLDRDENKQLKHDNQNSNLNINSDPLERTNTQPSTSNNNQNFTKSKVELQKKNTTIKKHKPMQFHFD